MNKSTEQMKKIKNKKKMKQNKWLRTRTQHLLFLFELSHVSCSLILWKYFLTSSSINLADFSRSNDLVQQFPYTIFNLFFIHIRFVNACKWLGKINMCYKWMFDGFFFFLGSMKDLWMNEKKWCWELHTKKI